MAGSTGFSTELGAAVAAEPQPVRAVRLGVVAGAMATQPWLSVVAPPPPSPPVPPPAMAAPGGRRVVLDALRAALRPLLLRFEYRVRTAVEGSSAASAIARAERQLVEQRVILESMERRIVALVAELAQLQQELSERRDGPIVRDRDEPGDPA